MGTLVSGLRLLASLLAIPVYFVAILLWAIGLVLAFCADSVIGADVASSMVGRDA